jgi:parallel beta-helix repeat protein
MLSMTNSRWSVLAASAAALVACSSSSGNGAAPNPDAGPDASVAIGSSSPLCTGTGRCVAIPAGAAESDISGAFATVKDGDTIAFAAGMYSFDNQLALGMANNVTIVGAGIGQTNLDFTNQKAGDDALFAQSVQNLTVRGLTIQNSPGNASRFLTVTGLTIDTVEVKWASTNLASHGAYGLYPVQCTNVLIENSKIGGAADSGIYVGQSQHIVVRNNEAYQNVAGIEIENSYYADVTGNNAHDNTGGILVFALPGLMQEGTHDVRVFMNTIQSNNTKNFAAMSDIVSLVPAGTGFFVMASANVEVFQNTISGNNTSAMGIISYAITQMAPGDPNYNQYGSRIYFHDNMFMNNGTKPDLTNQIGLVLTTGTSAYPGMKVPDVLWDGIYDNGPMPEAGAPADAEASDAGVTAEAGVPGDDGGPSASNPLDLCIQEPNASAVCNLNFLELDPNNPNEAAIVSCNSAPFNCSLPAVQPVSFPGL